MEQEFSREDFEQNRSIAALGYIVFFLPLILRSDSKLGRYCANQGLILTVLILLVSILVHILSSIPLIGWLFALAGGLASFALFCIGVLCFARMMTNDHVTELPYVGGLRLLP